MLKPYPVEFTIRVVYTYLLTCFQHETVFNFAVLFVSYNRHNLRLVSVCLSLSVRVFSTILCKLKIVKLPDINLYALTIIT